MHYFRLLSTIFFLVSPFVSSAQIEDVIYDQIFERKYTVVPYSMIKQYQIKGLEYYGKRLYDYG